MINLHESMGLGGDRHVTDWVKGPGKQVFLQTVKTQMKYSIYRVYTGCKGKKDHQTKEYNIFLKIIT